VVIRRLLSRDKVICILIVPEEPSYALLRLMRMGYRYTIPVVEGMRRTISWLAANGGIESSDADPTYDRVITAWERLSASLRAELAGIEQ